MKCKKQTNQGFSLIELSIVLVIVGILLYTGFGLGVAQLNIAKLRQTKDKLDKIQTALQLYYETNSALPCTASGTLAISNANFGNAGSVVVADSTASNATCTYYDNLSSNVYTGVVPVKSLNLPDEYIFDAWGNRITYAVSKHCIDIDNWDNSDLTTYTYKCKSSSGDTVAGGNITITSLGGTARTTEAAFIVVSHGKNGIGAWKRAGSSRITGGASTSTNEKENANFAANGTTDSYNASFIDGLVNDGTANTSTYFDDITRWRTAPQIQYDREN